METNTNAELEATQFNDASFFDEDKESLITKEERGESNPDLYRVSLDMETVKNKTYSSRGRFVRDPRWKDQNNKFMGKYHKKMYYLVDPDNTDRKFYAECPSNWNVPTSQNIVSVAFFKLRESDSATLKRIANNNFGQIHFWWSLFQILIDEQQPALQNSIKIMRFGKPINTTIQAAVDGKPELGKPGLDVYNPFRGKDFFVNVFEKTVEDKDKGGNATKSFPSYERSSFDDEITSMMINGERVKNDEAGRKAVIDYILKNAPELQQVEYKKWDDAMEQKIIESMRITIGDDGILDQVIHDARKGVKRSRVVVSSETKEKMEKEKTNNAPDVNKGKDKTANWSETKSEATQDEANFNDQGGSGEDAMSDGLPEISTEFEQGLD